MKVILSVVGGIVLLLVAAKIIWALLGALTTLLGIVIKVAVLGLIGVGVYVVIRKFLLKQN